MHSFCLSLQMTLAQLCSQTSLTAATSTQVCDCAPKSSCHWYKTSRQFCSHHRVWGMEDPNKTGLVADYIIAGTLTDRRTPAACGRPN